MIKTLNNIIRQDKEKFIVPKSVQQGIPIQAVWGDGIFRISKNKYSRTYKFMDINFEAGCGLIKYGSSLVPFINKFPKNTRLYKLMTTKPGEDNIRR